MWTRCWRKDTTNGSANWRRKEAVRPFLRPRWRWWRSIPGMAKSKRSSAGEITGKASSITHWLTASRDPSSSPLFTLRLSTTPWTTSSPYYARHDHRRRANHVRIRRQELHSRQLRRKVHGPRHCARRTNELAERGYGESSGAHRLRPRGPSGAADGPQLEHPTDALR